MTESASGFPKSKKIERNAFYQSVGTLTSRVFGLLRDMAMAAYFPRPVTDAWAAAFRFFHVYRRIISEGAIQQNLTPLLAQKDQQNQLTRSYILGLFFKTTFVLIAVAVALSIFASLLIEQVFSVTGTINTSNLNFDISQLTLGYFQIMVVFVVFISLYALSVSLLNYYGYYFIPAVAAVFFNLSMLGFIFVPEISSFLPGWGLAVGVSFGALLQFLVLIPYLKKLPPLLENKAMQSLKPAMSLSRLLLAIKPGRILSSLVSVGFLQFISLINLHFTAQLGVGAFSHFYLADRLLEFPQSLITASYCASLLPVLSRLKSTSEQYRSEFFKALKHNFWLLLAASLGLSFLAKPIAWLLFYRGHFGETDLQQLTLILQYYGPLILLFGLSRILLVHLSLKFDAMKILLMNVICLLLHFGLLQILHAELELKSILILNLVSCSVLFFTYAILTIHSWKKIEQNQ